MRIGIVGLGARSHAYVDRILKNPKFRDHKIVAICDTDPERLRNYSQFYFSNENCLPKCYTDWNELIADPKIEGVIITTPDNAHMEIVLEAIEKNKHIILEKPIEASIERATEIYRAGKNYNKTLMLGFVLRYAPFFVEVKKIIDSGELGEIISVGESENLSNEHSASYFRRWHRFRECSGGMMNTKCCHDIDLLNHLLGSRAERLASFGSNAVYVPHPDAAEHCCDCKLKDSCIYSFNYKNYGSPTNWDCQKDICVYNSEKEVFDRQMLLMEYGGGIPVTLELSMFSGEETRKIRISGTKAVLEGVSRDGVINIKPLDRSVPVRRIEIPAGESGHGGGDDGLLSRFFESSNGHSPINDVKAGYIATVTAVCSELSANEKRTLLLEDYLIE